MLTIRKAQFAAFAVEREHAFVRRTMSTLRQHWPMSTGGLTDEQLFDRVSEGIREARALGFVRSPDVRRYLNLTFALGPGFAVNPDLPWAGRICSERDLRPDERLDRLVQKAVFHLEGRQVA